MSIPQAFHSCIPQFPDPAVSTTTISACVLVIISLTILSNYAPRTYPRHPPGPRQLPFIGNAHQLPAQYQQSTFAEWGQEFGDLVYARFFSTLVLVLNHARTARALLEKRGAKYSSRAYFTYQRDIVRWDHLIIMPYSDRWRRQRRWFQTALLVRNTLNTYQPLQHREAQTLLRDIMRDPAGVLAHVRRYTAAIMFGIGYGYSPTSMDDTYIKMTEEAIKLVLEGGGPGSMLVDFLPILKYLPAWMPSMQFKRRGLKARGLVRDMERIPLERVKREMEMGTARRSMATALLDEAAAKGTLDAAAAAEEREIEIALAILYIAGTDTTSAMLSTFVLLMMLRPDVQRRVQEELDAVVGTSRLPTLADRAALPYLEAVIKEVYRWLAPAPLGTPHMLTEHDQYAGFDLAPGTVVIPNIWAMSRDETHFSDPDRFDPARFLDSKSESGTSTSAASEDARDPRKFVFGFGRRLCPGRVLADSSIFLAAASLLSAFDVRPPDGPSPRAEALLAPSAFTSGIVRHPKPFECKMIPRMGRGLASLV